MSSRSITTVDYTITASRRQFLPALGRQAAITSDSIIPRQILSSIQALENGLVGTRHSEGGLDFFEHALGQHLLGSGSVTLLAAKVHNQSGLIVPPLLRLGY